MSQPDNTSGTVVVAGGAGAVGEGIVAALLAAGASVLVPSRAQAKLDGLAERLAARLGPAAARLRRLVADVGTAEGRDALRRAAAEAAASESGPLRAVVSSLGGFWRGPAVRDVPEAALLEALHNGAFNHLRVAQTLLPLLQGDGMSLVQINGASALTAVPHSSALNLSGAAQLALTRSLIAEAPPDGPRIASFVIMQFVSTCANPLGDDALTADEVGEAVARFVADPPGHAIQTLSKTDGRVETRALGWHRAGRRRPTRASLLRRALGSGVDAAYARDTRTTDSMPRSTMYGLATCSWSGASTGSVARCGN